MFFVLVVVRLFFSSFGWILFLLMNSLLVLSMFIIRGFFCFGGVIDLVFGRLIGIELVSSGVVMMNIISSISIMLISGVMLILERILLLFWVEKVMLGCFFYVV